MLVLHLMVKICVAGCTTRNVKGVEKIIAGCTIRNTKNILNTLRVVQPANRRKNKSQLSSMKTIFVFFQG